MEISSAVAKTRQKFMTLSCPFRRTSGEVNAARQLTLCGSAARWIEFNFPAKNKAASLNQAGGFESFSALSLLRRKAELRFRSFCVRLRLSPGLLRRRFKRAEPADFIHDSLRIKFALEPFQRAVDRLSFANYDFRHVLFP
jgi:hypothetical protein